MRSCLVRAFKLNPFQLTFCLQMGQFYGDREKKTTNACPALVCNINCCVFCARVWHNIHFHVSPNKSCVEYFLCVMQKNEKQPSNGYRKNFIFLTCRDRSPVHPAYNIINKTKTSCIFCLLIAPQITYPRHILSGNSLISSNIWF